MVVFNSLSTLAVFLSLPFLTRCTSIASRATTCNGHPELCNKSFGNVTFVGAHDSYAVGNPATNLAVNQDYNITQQLNDGIRMLQMQAHNNSGQIYLCHSDCGLYNGGTLLNYLTTVKTWMDANPNDVVSLLIVNINNLPASSYASVFVAAGVDKLSYSPQSASLLASAWPSLGSMINAGTRLVTFMDNAADFATVPYIIDEFTNIWESAYDITNTALFNCQVNRSKVADPTTSMFLINHFLDNTSFGVPTPDVAAANVTNAVSGTGSLGAEVATCVSLYNRNPNFLLVDFYEYGGGSVFSVAAAANGVQYTGTVPPPASSNTGSLPSSTGSASHALSVGAHSLWTLSISSTMIILGALSLYI